jgi:hypothetical protein
MTAMGAGFYVKGAPTLSLQRNYSTNRPQMEAENERKLWEILITESSH